MAKKRSTPKTSSPAPETGSPAPETSSPAPETGSPAPETSSPAPETGSPASETSSPDPQCNPVPSSTDIPRKAWFRSNAIPILALLVAVVTAVTQIPRGLQSWKSPSNPSLAVTADYTAIELPPFEVVGLKITDEEAETWSKLREYSGIRHRLRLSITNSGDIPAKDVVVRLEGKSFVELPSKEVKEFDGDIALGDIRNSDTVTITVWSEELFFSSGQVKVIWVGGTQTIDVKPSALPSFFAASAPLWFFFVFGLQRLDGLNIAKKDIGRINKRTHQRIRKSNNPAEPRPAVRSRPPEPLCLTDAGDLKALVRVQSSCQHDYDFGSSVVGPATVSVTSPGRQAGFGGFWIRQRPN